MAEHEKSLPSLKAAEEEANEVALVEKVDVTKINVAEEFDIDDI